MAAIVPVYQTQQQQAQPPAPQSSTTKDPLFEALVKYITSGPGPSAISQTAIQDIIDSHNDAPGGREYLESIVNPPEFPGPIVWPVEDLATGFMSTNLNSLTVHFNTRNKAIGIPIVLNFHGSAPGFFPIQPVLIFNDAPFFREAVPNGQYDFEINNHSEVNMITVSFYDQVHAQSIDVPRKPIAKLELTKMSSPFRLPPSVKGTGTFTLIAQ